MRASATFEGRPGLRVAMGIIVALVAAACSSDNTTTTPPTPVASTVTIVSGNAQTGTVATAAGTPVVVQVKDQNGDPIAGVQVNFTVTGGGTLGTPTATTDASGNASTTVTLGNKSGVDSVNAAVSGVSQTTLFTLTAAAGAPSELVIVSGNNQSGTAGTNLASTLVVQVTDQFGNPIPGATVDWTTTAGTLVATAQSTSDANGMISDALQLPATAMGVTVTATLHGTQIAATFSETAM
jgi:hypothetical protein